MSDPVADFLAREQDMLAELDGDAPPPAPADDFADFEAAPAAAPVDVPANDIANEFDQLAVGGMGAVDSGVDLAAMDMSPAMPVNGGGLSNGGSSSGPSPVPMQMPRIEAENIRRWKEQHAVLIKEKDEAEEIRKEELRAAAKKELEEWYAQREKQLAALKEHNRKAEAEHSASAAAGQGGDAQWEEIAKLCDAKPTKGQRDTSRLKTLLLHLKHAQPAQ